MTTIAVDVETRVDHNYHQLPSDKTSIWEQSLPPEYFEYRRKWEEYPKSHTVEKFPIHLDIEATSNCNLLCTMCPRTDMVQDGTFWKVRNFDYDLFTRLVDEGVENGLCSIKFNYLGEPLMNPRIVEMVRYAREKGVLDVMFNTNATLLTEKTARQLIAAGLDKLFFSFDSPFPEHYNEIRVNANYDKTLRNIIRFHQIRNEVGLCKTFTRVSMVRMKENEHEWQAFRDLFEPIVDAVAFVDYMDHTSQRASGKQLVQTTPEKAKNSAALSYGSACLSIRMA